MIVQSPNFRMEAFSAQPPEDLINQWMPRQNHMTPLETLAAPTALHTWKDALRNQQVVHFIDNNSAAANLVKGYSPKVDTSPLIGEYWLTAATIGCDIYRASGV